MKINIVEVGPRDGLQNEPVQLTPRQRLWLIESLLKTGLQRIEVGAFVSPQWVPQMAQTGKVFKQLHHKLEQKQIPSHVRFSALVPNVLGLHDALQAGVREIAIFGACSESFSQKNINCSIEESLNRFYRVLQLARLSHIPVRGYLSTAFGCPYEGPISQRTVVRWMEKMMDLGIYEISISDTIGVATPRQVRNLLKLAIPVVGVKKIALHFHDTRGTALANVLAGLEAGVSTFDSSVGGLGGCPYARGASGNLATEDLVYMLEGMGVSTGIQLEPFFAMKKKLEKIIGHPLPGRTIQAGLADLKRR